MWDADGNPLEEFGQYVVPPSAPTRGLKRPRWNEDRECFVLVPTTPYQFKYHRRRHVGYGSSQITWYGGVWGEGDICSPVIFLHRTDNHAPYVARIMDEDREEVIQSRLPFKFLTHAEYGGSSLWRLVEHSGSAPSVLLDEPDLVLRQKALDGEGGAESDDEPSDPEDEQDSQRYIGWSGNWTREFIERAEAGEPLEPLTKEVWDMEKTWGVKVKLEPHRKSVEHTEDFRHDEDAIGKQRLAGYAIRAEVLEVYVKQSFVEYPEPEDDSSEAEVGETDVGEVESGTAP